jgi:hypothetical protein
VYKHANGPPSRLARIAGDKRCSKSQRRKPRLFRPTRIPCPAGPLERCRSRGQKRSGFWGSPLEGERRGITRSSLRRIELESSLQFKEEESSSVNSASCAATIAGPTPESGEDSARGYRARVSYFENFVAEVEGLRLAHRSIRINQTSGCARGPSRGNRVCKRNAISQRRNGAVRRRVGGKTNESRTGSRHEATPRGARQTSQDEGR